MKQVSLKTSGNLAFREEPTGKLRPATDQYSCCNKAMGHIEERSIGWNPTYEAPWLMSHQPGLSSRHSWTRLNAQDVHILGSQCRTLLDWEHCQTPHGWYCGPKEGRKRQCFICDRIEISPPSPYPFSGTECLPAHHSPLGAGVFAKLELQKCVNGGRGGGEWQ